MFFWRRVWQQPPPFRRNIFKSNIKTTDKLATPRFSGCRRKKKKKKKNTGRGQIQSEPDARSGTQQAFKKYGSRLHKIRIQDGRLTVFFTNLWNYSMVSYTELPNATFLVCLFNASNTYHGTRDNNKRLNSFQNCIQENCGHPPHQYRNLRLIMIITETNGR